MIEARITRCWWDFVDFNEQLASDRPSIEVMVNDAPRETGLVDASGRPLVRARERIGFAIPDRS